MQLPHRTPTKGAKVDGAPAALQQQHRVKGLEDLRRGLHRRGEREGTMCQWQLGAGTESKGMEHVGLHLACATTKAAENVLDGASNNTPHLQILPPQRAVPGLGTAAACLVDGGQDGAVGVRDVAGHLPRRRDTGGGELSGARLYDMLGRLLPHAHRPSVSIYVRTHTLTP